MGIWELLCNSYYTDLLVYTFLKVYLFWHVHVMLFIFHKRCQQQFQYAQKKQASALLGSFAHQCFYYYYYYYYIKIIC